MIHDDDPTFALVPPPDAKIPAPPAGFVAPAGSALLGFVPKTAHKASLPDVLEELTRFDDFDDVFGKTAPPFAITQRILQTAAAWTVQRAQMRAWDAYCRTQEVLAWRDARALMEQLTPAFELAERTDSDVALRYPGFKRLLSASKQIAQKSSATRLANEKLVADGKEPVRGSGVRRRRAQQQRAFLARLVAEHAAALSATPAAPARDEPPPID